MNEESFITYNNDNISKLKIAFDGEKIIEVLIVERDLKNLVSCRIDCNINYLWMQIAHTMDYNIDEIYPNDNVTTGEWRILNKDTILRFKNNS